MNTTSTNKECCPKCQSHPIYREDTRGPVTCINEDCKCHTNTNSDLTGNWHEISGPNGMCECGTEKGNCNDRLKQFIKKAIEKAVWLAKCDPEYHETLKSEAVQGERNRILVAMNEMEHQDLDLWLRIRALITKEE